jgi:hypothetical protein
MTDRSATNHADATGSGPPRKATLGAPPRVFQAIMSRFNIRRADMEDVHLDPAWMEARFEMMRRFFAASVRAQEWPYFEVWILCDVATPPDLLARIRALDPRISILLTGPQESLDPDRLACDRHLASVSRLDALVPPDVDVTAISRFDSDDALAHSFTRVVHERTRVFLGTDEARFLVVAGEGYQYSVANRFAVLFERPNIAMQTMYERADRVDHITGPYVGNHTQAPLHYVGIADTSEPLWLYVIHDHNKSGWMRRSPHKLRPEDLTGRFTVEW